MTDKLKWLENFGIKMLQKCTIFAWKYGLSESVSSLHSVSAKKQDTHPA